MIETDTKIARGVAALYLANVTTLVLNSLFLVLLTNYYAGNRAEVGLVSFLNVILVSATTFSVLALPLVGSGVVATPPAVTRFLSSGGGRGPSQSRVYFLSLLICGAISISILLVSAYPPISGLVAGPAQSRAVFFACLDALVYSFAQLGAYTLLGNDMSTSAGKMIILSSSLRYLFASALLLYGFGPSGVFAGFAIGDSVLAVLANVKSYQKIGRISGNGTNMSPVLKYMVSVFFAAIMGLLVTQSDKLLTFFQLGLSNLAIYNVATVGAAVASFIPSAATNVLVPALSGPGTEASRKKELLKSYTRHISLSAIPIGFLLAAISPFILRLFGDPYASGAPTMAVISVSISFTAIASVYSSSLLVEDRAHHFTYSNLLGLVGLLVVAFTTVPLLPAGQSFFGIALGRSAMLFIILGATAYYVRRQGSLVLDSPAYLKSLGASALMAGILFAALTALASLGLGRLPMVGASVVMIPVGLAVYILLMKALKAFNQEDMDFIDTLLPQSLRWISKVARKLL